MDPAANPDSLAGYDPSAFPPFAGTVDVVLTVINADLHVALIRHGEAPTVARERCPAGSNVPRRPSMQPLIVPVP